MSPFVWGARVSTTDASPAARSSVPVDAVIERLNDPGVAASLVTLLDNAELLSTLVLGLSGFISRGEQIMDAVAEGVNELKTSGVASGVKLPPLAELAGVTHQLAGAGPVLESVLGSAMVRPDTVALLSLFSEAATEGAANAARNHTSVGSIRSLYKLLQDAEIQRGMGLLVEIARALGRKL